MKNKITSIIIVSVAVMLFIGVVSIFLYKPTRDAVVHNKKVTQQEGETSSELPVLDCNYANDKDVYKDAITNKNINTCSCIVEKVLQDKCKATVIDINLYDQALTQLDEKICEKIRNEIKQGACHDVIQSSISQLQKSDPEYLARIYVSAHNEKAVEELEQITQVDEKNVNVHIALSLAYAEKGLKEQEQGEDQLMYVEKSIKSAQKAIDLDKRNSEAYRVLGYAYEIKPDMTKAIASYDKAIELDEKNSMAYAGRGHVYRMIGILDQAVVDFQKAAELDKNNENVFIYSNLCNLEYSRSNNEEAIKNCRTVTQIKNTDPVFQSETYQTMAQIFMDKNELQQAMDYLLKAKTLTPNDANLYVTFAQLNLKEGKYKQAEIHAKEAIDLSPLKAIGYLRFAHALYMQDKFNEAVEIAKKGIDLVNEDVSLLQPSKPAVKRDLNYAIANSYRQLGNTQKEQQYNQEAEKAFGYNNSLESN